MRNYLSFIVLGLALFIYSCEKPDENVEWIPTSYSESYVNISYEEDLIGSFTTGIYDEREIPEALKKLSYGRLEIDFLYNGGALESFMPLFYYGSVNKSGSDNMREETQDNLVVEIGHYNVVPFPLENLFYTICYDRYPPYCRDTDEPIATGINYTFVMDKRPEGNILQLKKGDTIVNAFPSAFFPDSSQLFFNDITNKINSVRGDSLDIVMMIGKGYVGFEKGLHDFNGTVDELRIYQYSINKENSGYEIKGLKNQLIEQREVKYTVMDHSVEEENKIILSYEFQPYSFSDGKLILQHNMNKSWKNISNNGREELFQILPKDIGFYRLILETVDDGEHVTNATQKPFEFWVYPYEWDFEY